MCNVRTPIIWAALACVILAAPVHSATNSLTSVRSVDGSGGYWHCGYQGNVSFTSPQSVARWVKLYVDGNFDGYASYLQRQGTDSPWGFLPLSVPNIWDYHGTSGSDYGAGGQHSVYTIAGVWNPSTGNGEVQSNTRSWTSGQ